MLPRIVSDTVCGCETTPALSFTVTVKLKTPEAVAEGVPPITPMNESSVSPDGRMPELMVQWLYGAMPPMALKVAE
jgi:hypothetical protein